MITKPTVFVLGAGASAEYGFPLGWDLVKKICEVARSEDEGVLSCLRQPRSPQEPSEISNIFADRLTKSASRSIDVFLEYQEDLREIGKIMIAAALIPCENEDKLDERGWYQSLFQEMKCPFDRFKDNQIKFITYNYDRSLEHFLATALANSYGKSPDASYNIVKSIEVVHVHGCLGNYVTGKCVSGDERAYSGRLDVRSIRAAASHIKIIHEVSDGNGAFKRAAEILKWAEQVFFVGFGYDPINIARLEPLSWIKPRKVIRGTAYEMTQDEKNGAIRSLMSGQPSSDVDIVIANNRAGNINEATIGSKIDLRLEDTDAASFIRELPWSELGCDRL